MNITTELKETQQRNFDHGKVDFVKTMLSDTKEIVLDFPIKSIKSELLPGVTIMVVTKNRKNFANIIIDNWTRINYPADKLELLIIDDSDDVKLGPILELKALKDTRISYCYINPNKESPHTIGSKRNHGISVAKHDFICMLDDDDFLYNDSIIARILTLLSFKKGCVYSEEIGVYNTTHESNYVVGNLQHVPEGSILLTRAFWLAQKFDETSNSESLNLISGRELDMMKIPWYFNYVALCHSKNTTNITKKVSLKDKDTNNKNKKTIECPINIWKTSFPKTFKKAIKKI